MSIIDDMVGMIRSQISHFALDLPGLTLVTGAAVGYDAAISTVAALARAKHVVALTRGWKRHPSAAQATAETVAIASRAGVASKIEILDHMESRRWAEVDVLVSCRQTWPISRVVIELLPPRSVITLTGADWELYPGAVDFDACASANVTVAMPALDHPSIRLLPELARLCETMVGRAGIVVLGARIAVICDTPCSPFIKSLLENHGATVEAFPHPAMLSRGHWDAIVVAMRPAEKTAMDIENLGRLADIAPQARLIQFSGEIDRAAANYFGLDLWPPNKPGRGQFGMPFSVLGFEPTLRRLVGSLKAAEIAYRGAETGQGAMANIFKPEGRLQ